MRLYDWVEYGQNCPFPFLVTDRERRLLYGNRPLRELCGYSLEHLFGRNLGHVVRSPVTLSSYVGKIREMLEREVPFSFSIDNVSGEGRPYTVGVYVIPFREAVDENLLYIGLEREMAKDAAPLDDAEFARHVRACLAPAREHAPETEKHRRRAFDEAMETVEAACDDTSVSLADRAATETSAQVSDRSANGSKGKR